MSRASSSLILAVLAAALIAGCGGPRPRPPADTGTLARATTPVAVDAATAEAFETGVDHLRAGRHAQAAAVFERIAAANGTLAAPRVNLGIARAQAGDAEGARRAFEAALAVDPADAVAHNELAILERRAGRFAEARRHYEQALAADPDYRTAHLNLGILCDLYLQDLGCAMTHYRRYQALGGEPDRQAELWMADLQARMQAQGGGGR